MKRILLLSLVSVALLWSFYATYDLLNNSVTRYAPQNIFTADDQGVLLISRLQELENGDILSLAPENTLLSHIEGIDLKMFPSLKVFASKVNPLLIIENEVYWKENQVNACKQFFPSDSINFLYDGRYLLITSLSAVPAAQDNKSLSFFEQGDKKASANFWEINSLTEKWKRTDIYALSKGFYEYKTQVTDLDFGKPVEDIENFCSVLPEQVETYNFYERFYAAQLDTVLANSLMFKWMDKGFVAGVFEGEHFIVTDNQPKQRPALLLLENSLNEDSVRFNEVIHSFVGFQLTDQFPQHKKGRIYVLELEDKSILTESKRLAERIQLSYSLGETLALNERKRKSFFEGLPTYANYRFVDASSKQSLTWNGDFIFEVSTLPPGESLLPTSNENWSHQLNMGKINSVTPIPDHLRGGNSVFVLDEAGKFMLLNQEGKLVWRGNLDTTVVGRPSVIDLYENKKHQLLVSSKKSLYLIDLNGERVANFPYRAENSLTTNPSVFAWNGTTRFLVGDNKGQIIMLNQNGQELTIIKVGNEALTNAPLALNVGGNLRAWGMNMAKNKYLGYLERQIKAEQLTSSKGVYFSKIGSEVFGFYNDGKKLFKEPMQSETPVFIGEGKFLTVEGYEVIAQNGNEIYCYNVEGDLLRTQTIGFNEIGMVKTVLVQGKKYLAVTDYLDNKVYLYNELGEVIEGFPKEAKDFVEVRFHGKESLLEVYTMVNKALVCYKTKV